MSTSFIQPSTSVSSSDTDTSARSTKSKKGSASATAPRRDQMRRLIVLGCLTAAGISAVLLKPLFDETMRMDLSLADNLLRSILLFHAPLVPIMAACIAMFRTERTDKVDWVLGAFCIGTGVGGGAIIAYVWFRIILAVVAGLILGALGLPL